MTEFASGLRDGYIEMTLNDQMPLNDRSMELMADLENSKSDREYDKLIVGLLNREIIRLGWKGCVNSSDIDVMRQVMELIQNHNHSIRYQISSLS